MDNETSRKRDTWTTECSTPTMARIDLTTLRRHISILGPRVTENYEIMELE